MGDNTEKAKTNPGINYPSIGNFIHYHIWHNHIKKVDVARAMGISPAGLTAYLKRRTWQFEAIWKASHQCKYNFLAQLGEQLPYPYETKTEKQLREQLAEKDALIQKMQIQLETLREMKK